MCYSGRAISPLKKAKIHTVSIKAFQPIKKKDYQKFKNDSRSSVYVCNTNGIFVKQSQNRENQEYEMIFFFHVCVCKIHTVSTGIVIHIYHHLRQQTLTCRQNKFSMCQSVQ